MSFHLKSVVLRGHTFHSLSPGVHIDGYCAHYKDFIVCFVLDKISVNLENFENLE